MVQFDARFRVRANAAGDAVVQHDRRVAIRHEQAGFGRALRGAIGFDRQTGHERAVAQEDFPRKSTDLHCASGEHQAVESDLGIFVAAGDDEIPRKHQQWPFADRRRAVSNFSPGAP